MSWIAKEFADKAAGRMAATMLEILIREVTEDPDGEVAIRQQAEALIANGTEEEEAYEVATLVMARIVYGEMITRLI